ncbi:MAG: hypothetical protein L6R37_006107 [Teloschistes peruensis]|nr:MAG: hypothetical protein L6R37_006107 [Teloschistes peruensis]
MSAQVAKKLATKYAKKHGNEHFKPSQDPYFVTREDGKVTKHKRKDVPEGISQADARVLLAVRRRAYRLDNSISICGIRFGLSSVVGLIPALGDFIDIFFAFLVYLNCTKVGLDARTKQKMAFNIALDFAIGLTPVLGDIADAFFKANTRNLVELEEFLIKKGQRNLKNGGGEGVGSGASSIQMSTPVRPQRTERMEYPAEAPPRYTSPERHNGAIDAPARTRTNKSTRSGRTIFGGRREREADVERGEALPPLPQPSRAHPRDHNEF